MISDGFIAEVRAQTDIVTLVSNYTELKKVGKDYKGLCLFHKEKTPSMSVSPEKQLFKCFGCGAGGDAVEFMKRIERKNFPEAIYSLALRIGLIEAEISDHKGTVYVLKLQQDKYYIGFTQNFDKRIAAHQSGNGALWTKKYPMIELLEYFQDVPFDLENEITQKYMSQYGWRNVRGGNYIFKHIHYEQTPEALHRKKKDGAYLLLLADGKYYVGFSQDMEADIHRQFQGKGLAWTKNHPPQRVIQKVKTLNVETAMQLTLQAMKDYGWENVRGYRWTAELIQRPKELDLSE